MLQAENAWLVEALLRLKVVGAIANSAYITKFFFPGVKTRPVRLNVQPNRPAFTVRSLLNPLVRRSSWGFLAEEGIG